MEFLGKKTLHIIIGLAITTMFAVFLWTGSVRPDRSVVNFLQKALPFDMLEAKLLDYRFLVRGRIKPPDNIVIAAIDEESISRLGGFPWSRDKIAGLVKKLADYGAELIMFDVILSESKENDAVLTSAFKDAGNVILPASFSFDRFVEISNGAVRAHSVLLPLESLASESMATGHINMLADRDGTLRWETTAIEHGGRVVLSIDLLTAALFLGVPRDGIDINSEKGIMLGKKRTIPLNSNGQFLINHYGRANTFRHISIADIVDEKVPPSDLQGRIVLIGATTAKGLFDLRVTPFTAEIPGIEKHASVIASIIEDRLLRKANPSTDLLILIISGIIFSMVVARLKAVGASVLTAVTLFTVLTAGYYFFVSSGLWLNVLFPSLNMLSIFIAVTAYNYAVEEKYARRIRAMFSNYATEILVDELIKNPDLARLGGERREVTVLFSDVRGFTTLSEKHEPEEVVATLNEYLGEMTQAVLNLGGTPDKFIGDAVMAFWGAPLRQDNHAELALKAALVMLSKLSALNAKWASEGRPTLDIGIGLNTGEVIVGNIGAEGMKMDYTVIGDHVNLASRVESLTKKYGAQVLITEFTLYKIRDSIRDKKIGHIDVIGLEKVIVKGKDQAIGLYKVLSLADGMESRITDYSEDKIVRMHEK